MLWLVPLIAFPIALAFALYLSGVSLVLVGELIALVFLIWLNCSVIVEFARSLKIGYVTALFFVPFFVTLPELITSTVLAQYGYGLASFMNAAFSVVMDLCFTFAIFTLAYYRTCRNVLYIQCPRITFPKAYAAVALLPPVVTLCMFVDFTKMKLCTVPALADPVDPIILFLMYVLLLVIPSAYYLAVHSREVEEIIIEEEKKTTFISAYRQVVVFIISLISLFFLSYQFAERMDIVCTLLGQKAGGILAAYLTSIPDAMFALAAFSPNLGEVKESLVELWGSSVHDMTRNIAFPALLYAYKINIMGLTGGAVIGNLPTLLAMWLAVTGWTVTHLVEGKGREIVATTRTATILLTIFALCTIIGLVL